jgi:formate-dependent nitrite reductase membrane component NrfD
MNAPFGYQIVIYLFLAGVAAGSALFASWILLRTDPEAFAVGKRSLVLSIVAIGLGVIFLIADLANPMAFFLILTEANPASAIAWGARIVTCFSLVAFYCWAQYRRLEAGGGAGSDRAALWVLRLLALALAIYPGFVLMQGKAMALWSTWIIVPLIALSGLHAGFAASSLFVGNRYHCLSWEKVLLTVVGVLLVAMLVVMKAVSPLAILVLASCVLIPFALVDRKAGAVTSLSVLAGSFILRAWLITDGQTLFF